MIESNNFKKIKKYTIVDNIIEQINKMIKDKNIKAGERLPSEREMAELFNVSRPSVREAMKALDSVGIIEIMVGKGTFLKKSENIILEHFQKKQLLKEFNPFELIETRKSIEIDVAEYAAYRRNDDDILIIKESFSRTQNQSLNNEEIVRADFDLHMAISKAAKNFVMSEFLVTIRDLMLEINIELISYQKQVALAHEAHKEIVDAIENRDRKKAGFFMEKHLEDIKVSMEELYGKHGRFD